MREPTDNVALDRSDLQGNILRGYGFPQAAYLFVRVGDAGRGRDWLGELAPSLTNAELWSNGKPQTTLNLALSFAGLEALGVPAGPLAAFPDDFRQGMAARAHQLADVGGHAPANWEPGLGSGDAHVLVMVNAQEAGALDDEVRRIREGIGDGLEPVHEQRAAVLEGNREHFGFSDGFAQPAIEGDGVRATPGQGTPEKDGKWSELELGEFVLGYPDGDEEVPRAPDGPLGRNGTYMVYRKLHQDVALFRRVLREAAEGFPGGEELLAAKIVGRWRDGTPLVLSPDGRDRERYRDPELINDFRYEDDLDGCRCPIGAHVRRTNPRDALGWHGTRSRRHRMIRRGMPYGPPLAEGATEDDGNERGLIFVCFCASLARQFEVVQRQWCGDGNIFGLGDDKDFLVLDDARETAKMTIQGDPPCFLSPQPRTVTLRGGEYLFVPSLSGLAELT
ncbi:MAG: Dyp-type peroxidase [Actinomycetota bacterium]|nr:Dyp-type peroxidase [Actinomycetota bacterium]